MRFRIVAVDKMRSRELRTVMEAFCRRLGYQYSIMMEEIKPCTRPNYSDLQVVQDEGARIMDLIANDPVVVVLDEHGELLTSVNFARWINAQAVAGQSMITFVIGGANGLSEQVRKRGDFVLSLSKMTMLHEVARMILVEQLYRATTILAGHPYHK